MFLLHVTACCFCYITCQSPIASAASISCGSPLPGAGPWGGGRKAKDGPAPPVTPAKRMCLAPGSSPVASSPGGPSGAGSMSFGPHQARALSIMAPTAHPSHFFVNATHWAEVEAAWQLIVDHPVFSGIMSEMPLPINETGTNAFTVADFKRRWPAAIPTPVGRMPSGRHPSTPHRQVSPSTAPASTPLLSDPHAPPYTH